MSLRRHHKFGAQIGEVCCESESYVKSSPTPRGELGKRIHSSQGHKDKFNTVSGHGRQSHSLWWGSVNNGKAPPLTDLDF